MTVEELIAILEEYPSATQVFVMVKDLRTPDVSMYDMDDLPEILVIS